jgi:hypothetical protein
LENKLFFYKSSGVRSFFISAAATHRFNVYDFFVKEINAHSKQITLSRTDCMPVLLIKDTKQNLTSFLKNEFKKIKPHKTNRRTKR